MEKKTLLIERESKRTENKAKLKQIYSNGNMSKYILPERTCFYTNRFKLSLIINVAFFLLILLIYITLRYISGSTETFGSFFVLFFFFYMTWLLNNSITNGGKYWLRLRVAIKTVLYRIKVVYFNFNIGGKKVSEMSETWKKFLWIICLSQKHWCMWI